MESINKNKLLEILSLEKSLYPLSSKYNINWVLENNMGPNPLWFTELLCNHIILKPGMKVLDLGCGTALSSIFLAKEYGVQVWATDLWINATENWKRIKEAGVEDKVYPIYSEAHSLPFADEFFDVIISVDAYQYFGTDEMYLMDHLIRLIKPLGQIGIVVPGLKKEFINGIVPSHMKDFWCTDMYQCHSDNWWYWHWKKTDLIDIEMCRCLQNGWELWAAWEDMFSKESMDKKLLHADNGEYLSWVMMVGNKIRN